MAVTNPLYDDLVMHWTEPHLRPKKTAYIHPNTVARVSHERLAEAIRALIADNHRIVIPRVVPLTHDDAPEEPSVG